MAHAQTRINTSHTGARFPMTATAGLLRGEKTPVGMLAEAMLKAARSNNKTCDNKIRGVITAYHLTGNEIGTAFSRAASDFSKHRK